MKWFLKCLRHYADFTGRARRREFWLFTLFNIILMTGGVVSVALFVHFVMGTPFHLIYQHSIFAVCWSSLTFLPSLAARVRRLHDLGQSGWMILIALIPIVGALWLIVLFATEGEYGPNRFGLDPKTGPESFPDNAKLTSTGITLIIPADISLVLGLSNLSLTTLKATLLVVIAAALLCAAGVMMLQSRGREHSRGALRLLLGAAAMLVIYIIFDTTSFLQEFKVTGIPFKIVELLANIAMVVMATVLLTSPGKRKLIRPLALALMVLAGLVLLAEIIKLMNSTFLFQDGSTLIYVGLMIMPVSYIVVAWTFFSKARHEPESVSEVVPES